MAETEPSIAIPEELTVAESGLSAGVILEKEALENKVEDVAEKEPLRKKAKVENTTHEEKPAGEAVSVSGTGGEGMEVDVVPEAAAALPPGNGDGHRDENLKKEEVGTAGGQEDIVKVAPPVPPTKVRYKKRKIAILMAYIGAGYRGMQRNPGAQTIEGELELALHKAGAIPDDNFGDPKTLDWMRAARTDKGVSAVGQVVSGLFIIEPPGLVERLNKVLPPQIRVFDFVRVTKSFSAKQLCDRRRYEYVLPTFAFDPEAHRERAYYEAKNGGTEALEGSKEAGEDTADEKLNGRGVEAQRAPDAGEKDATTDKPCSSAPASGDCAGGQAAVETGTGFKFTKEVRDRLNRVLKKYVGTHNFHNFTAKVDPMDPSANRYILSFEASEPFTLYGQEYVRCTVLGQSFMLHQIRKMIGCAVAIMRGVASESVIDMAYSRDKFVTVPMAPELGLFLDECLYTSYNNRYCDTHQELSLRNLRPQVDLFKQNFIYKHIAETDQRESVVATWLKSLNDRNYSGFAAPLDHIKPPPLSVLPPPPPRVTSTAAPVKPSPPSATLPVKPSAPSAPLPVEVSAPSVAVLPLAGKGGEGAGSALGPSGEGGVALPATGESKGEPASAVEVPADLPPEDGGALPVANADSAALPSEGAQAL